MKKVAIYLLAFMGVSNLQAQNVGIGTTTPTDARLQIQDNTLNTQFLASAGSNLPGISAFVPSNFPTLGFNTRYQSGYKFMGAGYAGFLQFSPTTGRLSYFYSNNIGVADGTIGSVFGMVIDSSGRMGLGTSTPNAPLHVTGNVVFGSSSITPAAGFRLSVDGKIICEELKVQISTGWPDYVFSKAYRLPSYGELRKYIAANKHLPNIPAANEVEKNGLQLGDMQKLLMEKVEELTLYILELENRVKEMEKKK